MIRSAAGTSIVGADVQLRTVMHQAIKHVRRFMTRRRHYLDMVGTVLIGEMSVEAEARIAAVARVDLAGGVAPLGGAEKLPVRRRG